MGIEFKKDFSWKVEKTFFYFKFFLDYLKTAWGLVKISFCGF